MDPGEPGEPALDPDPTPSPDTVRDPGLSRPAVGDEGDPTALGEPLLAPPPAPAPAPAPVPDLAPVLAPVLAPARDPPRALSMDEPGRESAAREEVVVLGR